MKEEGKYSRFPKKKKKKMKLIIIIITIIIIIKKGSKQGVARRRSFLKIFCSFFSLAANTYY